MYNINTKFFFVNTAIYIYIYACVVSSNQTSALHTTHCQPLLFWMSLERQNKWSVLQRMFPCSCFQLSLEPRLHHHQYHNQSFMTFNYTVMTTPGQVTNHQHQHHANSTQQTTSQFNFTVHSKQLVVQDCFW